MTSLRWRRFPGRAAERRCRSQKVDVIKQPTGRVNILPRGEERAEFPSRGVRPDAGKEKRRFRGREWWDCSTHREPRSRTRRSVCKEDHTCPEGEETGHKRSRPESGRQSLPSRLLPQESADGPSSKRVRPMNRLRRTSEGNAMLLGCWARGEYVRTSAPLNRPCAYVRGRGR